MCVGILRGLRCHLQHPAVVRRHLHVHSGRHRVRHHGHGPRQGLHHLPHDQHEDEER